MELIFQQQQYSDKPPSDNKHLKFVYDGDMCFFLVLNLNLFQSRYRSEGHDAVSFFLRCIANRRFESVAGFLEQWQKERCLGSLNC